MQILPLFVRLDLTFQVLHFLVLLSSRVLPFLIYLNIYASLEYIMILYSRCVNIIVWHTIWLEIN